MIFTNLITTNLRTKTFGKEIAYYQRLESTNLESWELIDEKSASHGMIVITDNQSGRDGSDTLSSIENFQFSDGTFQLAELLNVCLLYTSPSPRDLLKSRMPSSA